jgi:hypothetical protein
MFGVTSAGRAQRSCAGYHPSAGYLTDAEWQGLTLHNSRRQNDAT